jgi:hypothetical protein
LSHIAGSGTGGRSASIARFSVAPLSASSSPLAATDAPDPDDPRTLAQRRAAGAVRLGRSFLHRRDSPTEDGERPHIAITVPLESLASGTFETTGDLSLAGSQISELLCDSKLQVIVTGPDGQPLDVGAAVYRPSRRLRRAVLYRDQGRCRYPGCDRTHGQVHHVIPFPAGKTVIANLVFLCDYHHHVLHKPGCHATFDGTTFTVTNRRPTYRQHLNALPLVARWSILLGLSTDAAASDHLVQGIGAD